MTARTTPPFRADHVGSFLRPKFLLDAREQFFVRKEINAEQLRAVEDKAIAEIVRFQQEREAVLRADDGWLTICAPSAKLTTATASLIAAPSVFRTRPAIKPPETTRTCR